MTTTERLIKTLEGLVTLVEAAPLTLTGKQTHEVAALLQVARGFVVDITNGGVRVEEAGNDQSVPDDIA